MLGLVQLSLSITSSLTFPWESRDLARSGWPV